MNDEWLAAGLRSQFHGIVGARVIQHGLHLFPSPRRACALRVVVG